MGMYESLVRPLAFRMDPERVHNWAMFFLRRGLISAPVPESSRLEQTLMGCRFPNPIGLAAGFDKNGELAESIHRLGFGFAELGTATFHAQPGNPKPRMFRIPEEQGLVNRMGFNNEGSAAVARRLKGRAPYIPIGVNIGKSKITPVEEAASDYEDSAALFEGIGDYLALNVSSPNTPGLRLLQAPDEMKRIIERVRASSRRRHILIKLAPDLADEDLDALTDLAAEMSLTGIIATNTTVARGMLRRDPRQDGGLSGRPLKEMADAALMRIARRAPKNLLLIGVGGIMDGDDAYDKIRMGAHLVQVYTGWIYGGPKFCQRACGRILERMEADRAKSLDDVRGSLL